MATQLEGLTKTVLRAYGGREAIDIARRELPDVIVLDLLMPEVNGFDVVAALNEHADTAAIPILVVTAKKVNAADRAKLKAHVTRILMKGDFDLRDFATEVRRAMSGKRTVA